MFESIKNRYAIGYIRPDQLERYVSLKVITQQQADEITGAAQAPERQSGTSARASMKIDKIRRAAV